MFILAALRNLQGQTNPLLESRMKELHRGQWAVPGKGLCSFQTKNSTSVPCVRHLYGFILKGKPFVCLKKEAGRHKILIDTWFTYQTADFYTFRWFLWIVVWPHLTQWLPSRLLPAHQEGQSFSLRHSHGSWRSIRSKLGFSLLLKDTSLCRLRGGQRSLTTWARISAVALNPNNLRTCLLFMVKSGVSLHYDNKFW